MILFALVVLVSVISINDVFGQFSNTKYHMQPLIVMLNKTSIIPTPVTFPTDIVGIGTKCTPSSGSAFDVGTTIVICTIKNKEGNIVKAEFPVKVVAYQTNEILGVDVIFKPDPVIFNKPFKIEMVFKNLVDDKIVSNVSYSSKTNCFNEFACDNPWKYDSNIIGPTVEADGIVNQTAILENYCCTGWKYEIKVSGFNGNTTALGWFIPINVEKGYEENIPNKIKPTPIPILDTDGDGVSDSLDSCPGYDDSYTCPVGLQKTIKVTLPLNFKNTAGYWASGQITDNQFLQLAQIEINRGTMIIPDMKINGTGNSGAAIPSWVKNNAGWVGNTISDTNFISTIQFLFQEGILPVKVTLKDIPITEPVLKPTLKPLPIPEATADEKKAADKKIADKKIADKKAADKKIADKKAADKKAADKKIADKKIADAKKAADKKAADKKAAEAKKAQK